MIVFAWRGFPQYAARCVADFVKQATEEVVVVATRPRVPIEGMERLVGCPVRWVETGKHCSFAELGLSVPRVILTGSWEVMAFNDLCREVRASGGKTVIMNDSNCRLSFKEILRTIRYRLFLRRRFDACMVPGASGLRLAKLYGIPEEKTATGLYSADESLFKDGKPILEREKRIVYIGQFIPRKNVMRLVEAFAKAGGAEKGWTLALYGSGVQKAELEAFAAEHKGVEVNAFTQPEQLAAIYQSARVFALASLEEHWGLVVHEGALSGCYLYLSDRIGAAEDLLGQANGSAFDPFSLEEMTSEFEKVFAMSDEEWTAAHDESVHLASKIGVASFTAGVNKLLRSIG